MRTVCFTKPRDYVHLTCLRRSLVDCAPAGPCEVRSSTSLAFPSHFEFPRLTLTIEPRSLSLLSPCPAGWPHSLYFVSGSARRVKVQAPWRPQQLGRCQRWAAVQRTKRLSMAYRRLSLRRLLPPTTRSQQLVKLVC